VPIPAFVTLLRAVVVALLLLAPVVYAQIVVDVPVRLRRTRLVFNIDQPLVTGDEPTVFVWLDEMLLHFQQWHTHWKVIGIFHGGAGSWTLNDAAYDHQHGTTTGNPYAARLTELQARGVRFELCAYSMQLNGWTNADLLPGVAVTTGAIARLVQLHQRGWTQLQP
jgi:intracellular sulfur oxidation DsrE/DsrF family protein